MEITELGELVGDLLLIAMAELEKRRAVEKREGLGR